MLHLGSIRGTPIDVDFNFMVLIVFFVAMNYDAQAGLHYALLWIPILFLSVLVHELAHAAAFGLLGFGSSHIILNGMGGVTYNDSRNVRPWQDVLISVAGPASSFALMAVSMWLAGTNIAHTDKMVAALLPRMQAANFFWGVFNLIPLHPLDGGHATRSFFRMFLDERRSFTIATWVGLVVGAGVVVLALMSRSIFLALYVAFFMYMAWQRWQDFRQSGIPRD
ncbi:MAG TPA: M50 family metallopeptidase [Thermoanaerobaculia bacterium]|nr:M50 family metallopeptidase [Thermoanaerobaculia bacterium]